MVRILFLIFMTLILVFSCKNTKTDSKKIETVTVDVEKLDVDSSLDPAYTLRTPEQLGKTHNYSKRTVLVSFSEPVSEDEAKEFAKKLNLDLTYFYSNFNMCALSSKRDLTDEEMHDLILHLERLQKVLQVERDEIMHLDSEED